MGSESERNRFYILIYEHMQITKRVERLYSLAAYENIKVVYEATEEIGNEDPKEGYARLSKLLAEELANDAKIYKK